MVTTATRGRKASRQRSGTYVLDVYVKRPDGTRQRIVKQGFKTITERDKALAEIRQQEAHGVDVVAGATMTVRELGERYTADKTATQRGANTIEVIERAFLHINRAIGTVPLGKLDSAKIDDLRDTMARTLAPGSQRLYLSKLRAALSWAMRKRWIQRNVATESNLPPTERAEFFLPSHKQFDLLLDSIAEEGSPRYEGGLYRLFFDFLANTGLRLREALGLRWEDMDVQRLTITVRKHEAEASGRQRLKSDAARRTLSIRQEDLDGLATLRDRQLIGGGWIFVRPNGSRLEAHAVQALLRRQSQELGFHAYAHLFRHYHASTCLEAGMDFYQLQKRLGHKNINITLNTYGHLRADSDRAAVERAAALRAAR